MHRIIRQVNYKVLGLLKTEYLTRYFVVMSKYWNFQTLITQKVLNEEILYHSTLESSRRQLRICKNI